MVAHRASFTVRPRRFFLAFDAAQALLSTPSSRRKKRYILYLVHPKFVSDSDIRVVTRAVGSACPEHTLIRLEDPDEAIKVLLLKNIELIVIDHSFFQDDVLAIEYGVEIKKRKKCSSQHGVRTISFENTEIA